MIRIVIFTVLLSVGGALDLSGQSEVIWHRTPERRDGSIRNFAVASDSVIWCMNNIGVFRVDLNGVRPRAGYRYYSEGEFSSIWVRGSTILLVDVTAGWKNNRVVRSSDDGLTWITVDIGRQDIAPVLLRSDEQGDLFLGCSNATLLTSRDSGKTWEEFAAFERIQKHTALVPLSVSRDDSQYYCSVVDYSRTMGGSVNRYYRRDSAGNWKDISLEGASGGTGTAEWEIGRISSGLLYGTYFNHTLEAKIRISSDRGESWQEPPPIMVSHPSWSNGPGSIVNSAGQVYIGRALSTSNESAAVSRFIGDSFVDLTASGVVASFSRGPDGRIWALVGYPWTHSVFSLWQESDSSDSLEQILAENDLEFENPLLEKTVRELAARKWSSGGHWYAVVDSSGIWHTTDKGRNWLPVIPIERQDWTRLTDVNIYEATRSVYLGGADGIGRVGFGFRVLWESVTSHADVATFEVGRDRGMIVETADGRILRIDDDSGVGEEVGPSQANSTMLEQLLTVDPFGRAFVSTADGLYYLPVASPVWGTIPIPQTIDPAAIQGIDVTDLTTLALAAEEGVFTSRDFGVTWMGWGQGVRPVDQILATSGRNVETDLLDPVVLAVAGDSIWYTTDLGISWVNINGDLPEGEITAITVDSSAGCIVVAVQGEGVFWSATPSVTGIDHTDLTNADIVRPLLWDDGGLKISISADQQPDVTVYDLIGREISGNIVWSQHGERFTGLWWPDDLCPKLLFVRVGPPGTSSIRVWKVLLP